MMSLKSPAWAYPARRRASAILRPTGITSTSPSQARIVSSAFRTTFALNAPHRDEFEAIAIMAAFPGTGESCAGVVEGGAEIGFSANLSEK